MNPTPQPNPISMPADARGMLRDVVARELEVVRKCLLEAQRRMAKLERKFVAPDPPPDAVEIGASAFLYFMSINNAVAHAFMFDESFAALLVKAPLPEDAAGTREGGR